MLIVAHRLDVVLGCDAVAVVEDGHLTSVGSHREALERSPLLPRRLGRLSKVAFHELPRRGGRFGAGCLPEMTMRVSTARPPTMKVPSMSQSTRIEPSNPFARTATSTSHACARSWRSVQRVQLHADLIWFCTRCSQSEIDLQALLSISAAIVAVLVARLAVCRVGLSRPVGGARVKRDLRILMGDTIKRIPLSPANDKAGGEYLQALTVNVNDYERDTYPPYRRDHQSAVLAAMLACSPSGSPLPASW